MKRVALLLALIAATPVMAFRPSLRRGDRVGVLRPSPVDERGADVAGAVTRSLQRELRSRGIDAVDSQLTFDELRRDDRRDADYYVEVVSGDTGGGSYGGVGLGGRSVGVDIALVVSRVAATLRLYDGRTLELIDSYDMQRRATSVVPAGVSIGGTHAAVWVALPFVQYARYRVAARAVAADAADAIAGQTRAE